MLLPGSCITQSLQRCILTQEYNTAEPGTQREGAGVPPAAHTASPPLTERPTRQAALPHACPFPEKKSGPGGRSPVAEKAAGTQPLACSLLLLLLFLLPGLLAIGQFSHLVVPRGPCGHGAAWPLLTESIGWENEGARAEDPPERAAPSTRESIPAPRPTCAASGPAAGPAPRVSGTQSGAGGGQRAPWRRPPGAGSCSAAGRYFSNARARQNRCAPLSRDRRAARRHLAGQGRKSLQRAAGGWAWGCANSVRVRGDLSNGNRISKLAFKYSLARGFQDY